MSDTQQGPEWWLASDGKWYPPEQAQHLPPPPMSATEVKKSPPIWVVLGLIGALLAVGILAAAFADDGEQSDTSYSPPSTIEDFTGSDGAALSSAERQLVADVDAIYPGIGEARYIVNWSEYLCDDIDDGMSGTALTQRAIDRFAGGSRPDPTPAQAEQIIAAVESSGLCR